MQNHPLVPADIAVRFDAGIIKRTSGLRAIKPEAYVDDGPAE